MSGYLTTKLQGAWTLIGLDYKGSCGPNKKNRTVTSTVTMLPPNIFVKLTWDSRDTHRQKLIPLFPIKVKTHLESGSM